MSKEKIKRKFEQARKSYLKANKYESQAIDMIKDSIGIDIRSNPIIEDYWIDSIELENASFDELWELIKNLE